MGAPDEFIQDHRFEALEPTDKCKTLIWDEGVSNLRECGQPSSAHAIPQTGAGSFVEAYPHAYVASEGLADHCGHEQRIGGKMRKCGYPESEHEGVKRRNLPVRVADVQQYAREPMPSEARGRVAVTLIDAPVDPFGTLAVIAGIYKGKVARSKGEVTDEDRVSAWEQLQKTVLDGPLEAVQFTFLFEGVDRAFTHQAVRDRFSFFAQESLRFAVAEDWAAEVALPPSLAGLRDDDPRVGLWRKSMNQAEDNYAAMVAAGVPAEEARGALPHAIPTRYYETIRLRTLLQEAGKRTCTQAQFHWRMVFAQIAKALRARGEEGENMWQLDGSLRFEPFLDNWQYRMIADALRPICYQTGRCGFKADFDRACSIRDRVDDFERHGIPSSQWPHGVQDPRVEGGRIFPAIHDHEWAADPGAARITEEK